MRATERNMAAVLLALDRSMRAVADLAVDGGFDGLHDLLALEEVVVLPMLRVELVVPGETLSGELVAVLALLRA